MSNPSLPPEQTPGPTGEPSPGRRRLLQGGLAAAPVALTLVSRPVLGQQTCQTVSAFLSANASRPSGLPVCVGQSANFWIENGEQWPAPYVAKTAVIRPAASESGTSDKAGAQIERATQFHSTTTGCQGTFFGGKSMLEVLQLQGGGMYDLARLVATGLLNSASGLTPVIDETGVRQIWNSYVGVGYFEPTAGVKWYCEECIQYLQSTIA